MLGFFPVGAAELREADGQQNGDESTLKHGFASSEVVPMKVAIAQICWTSAPKKRIGMLGLAVSSLSESLEDVAEGGFEVEKRDGKIRNGFPMRISYCCEIFKAENISAARQEADRRQPWARCQSTFEDRVKGKKSSRRVVAKAFDTRRKVGEKEAEGASLNGSSRSTRR